MRRICTGSTVHGIGRSGFLSFSVAAVRVGYFVFEIHLLGCAPVKRRKRNAGAVLRFKRVDNHQKSGSQIPLIGNSLHMDYK